MVQGLPLHTLGGNRGSKLRLVFNILVVFILSGLWHGANLTFVFWGLVHALFVIPVLLFMKNYKVHFNVGRFLPTGKEFVNITFTFMVVVVSWVFFRSETLTDAFQYLGILFSETLFTMPAVSRLALLLLFGFMTIEWLQRHQDHFLDITNIKSRPLRYTIYFAALFSVFYFAGDVQPFIYFQF